MTLLAAPHPTLSAAGRDLTRSLPSGLQLAVQGLTLQEAGTGAQRQPSPLLTRGGLCRGLGASGLLAWAQGEDTASPGPSAQTPAFARRLGHVQHGGCGDV